MKTISLADFASQIEAKRLEIGMVDDAETTEALRNKGTNRTRQKRSLWKRIEERALEAGRKPTRSYY